MIKFIRTTDALHVAKLDKLPFDWGIVHMLTDEPMTLDEVVMAAWQYNEDYSDDGAFDTNHVTVAYSLVRLCEVGMAAIVDEEAIEEANLTNEPQPYTAEEVRQKMLSLMRAYINVWLQDGQETVRERMEGLVFSILNIFDGTTLDLPAMDIVLRPHPDNRQFAIDEGERWYENGMVINDCVLHEEWYK